MDEKNRIKDLFNRAYYSKSWHGDSISKIIEGLTWEECRKKLNSTHTIAELILHMIAWKNMVSSCLSGANVSLSDEEDWPKPDLSNDSDWEKIKLDLERAHVDFIGSVDKFDFDKMNEIVQGQNYPFFVMIYGLLEHDIYHAGQIAIIKKNL